MKICLIDQYIKYLALQSEIGFFLSHEIFIKRYQRCFGKKNLVLHESFNFRMSVNRKDQKLFFILNLQNYDTSSVGAVVQEVSMLYLHRCKTSVFRNKQELLFNIACKPAISILQYTNL